jgi:hypothetical protein
MRGMGRFWKEDEAYMADGGWREVVDGESGRSWRGLGGWTSVVFGVFLQFL